jgi:hypothetical protein
MPSEPSNLPATEVMDDSSSLQPSVGPGPAAAGADAPGQQPPVGAGGGGGMGQGFPVAYQQLAGYGPMYAAAYGGHYPIHPGAYGGAAAAYQMGMPPNGQMGMPPNGQMGMPPNGQMGMPPNGQMGMPQNGQMGMPQNGQMGMPQNGATYGAGPYPYGRPPYPYGGYAGDPSQGGGNAGGFYPGQQQRVKQASPGRSSRGGHSSSASPRRNTTTLANVNVKGGLKVKAGIVTEEAKKAESADIERLRSAAEKELTQMDVKPIQSDFHFFVAEMRDKLKAQAEDEVRQACKSEEKLDSYLVYSNLNCRLMKAWEGLTDAEHEVYIKKEQEDRRRFMQDDEVASRHCATLTARARSPDRKDNVNGEEEEQEDNKRQPETNDDDNADVESPSKKNRVAEVESIGV